MGEIEKLDRDTMLERAFTMYVDGTPIQQIADKLGIHRNSARNYITEYATNNIEPDERVFRQRVSMARLDKVIAHAMHLLEHGDIKDSSLSRPQLLHQVTSAIKEQNKVSGLHVSLMHVKHEHDTVSNMVKSLREEAERMGYTDFESYLNRRDYEEEHEDIEDAEIVEEDIPTRDEQP